MIDTNKLFYQLRVSQPCYCEMTFRYKKDMITVINRIRGRISHWHMRAFKYKKGIHDIAWAGVFHITTSGNITVKF